jgi:hypothetical protein
LMAVLVTALSVQSLAVILLGRARVFSHCCGSGRWHGVGAAGPVGCPVGLASVVRLMAVLVTALSVQSLAVILLGRARVFSHCCGSGRWYGVGAAGLRTCNK